VGRRCADRRGATWRRPGARVVPITGAGLDPSCTPAGIPSNGSDGEGCWGRETAGTDADVGVVVVRIVAVPHGRTAVVGIVDPGAAAQQLNDPPSTSPYAHRELRGGSETKIIRDAYGAITQQPQSNSQGQNQPKG
jgi:hypothetical protein